MNLKLNVELSDCWFRYATVSVYRREAVGPLCPHTRVCPCTGVAQTQTASQGLASAMGMCVSTNNLSLSLHTTESLDFAI
jgi:hypothetical protein